MTALLSCMIFLPVCGAQVAPAQSETHPVVIGELLDIKVVGEPELSGTAVVQPDGRITLPLVNGVHAAGLTLEQLQGELEQKLRQFVAQPRVTVVAAGMAEQRHIWLSPETPRPWLLPELWPSR
ncbi:MAG TPA: polysaccharide biosynthesis/export family protein [Candidatus Sulfotelmatobacter sp.]|nr:polysaccharide biosynthesis/export family protein [Candidatus Sulfotelmatobacter sp.]